MASVSHRILYESEFDQKLSLLSCIASAHSSNKLQEMGSRGRRDAEFQGGKYPNLHFNKLVSGVRVGRDDRVSALGEDLHTILCKITASQIQTKNGVRQRVTVIDGHCQRLIRTGYTSGAPRMETKPSILHPALCYPLEQVMPTDSTTVSENLCGATSHFMM